MPIQISRGAADAVLEGMIGTLRAYQADHPEARVDLYRQDCVSIRVRIIDPDFSGLSRTARHDEVWRYLDRLPDDVQQDLSSLVLLAPDEVSRSFANMEFENPVPSPT